MPTLTQTADTLAAELTGRGYVPLDDHAWLTPGVRVRHIGEQYDKARDNGTAVVVAVFAKPLPAGAPASQWRDIEVVIERDTPRFPGTEVVHHLWADYHCAQINPRT